MCQPVLGILGRVSTTQQYLLFSSAVHLLGCQMLYQNSLKTNVTSILITFSNSSITNLFPQLHRLQRLPLGYQTFASGDPRTDQAQKTSFFIFEALLLLMLTVCFVYLIFVHYTHGSYLLNFPLQTVSPWDGWDEQLINPACENLQ